MRFVALLVFAGCILLAAESARIEPNEEIKDEDSDGSNNKHGFMGFFSGVVGGLKHFVKGIGNGIKTGIKNMLVGGGNNNNDDKREWKLSASTTATTSTNSPGRLINNEVSTTPTTRQPSPGITLPFGSVFGHRKTDELKLISFVTSGILDDRGNVVGSLTNGQGELTNVSIKLVNHLEDLLNLTQVNALINRKLCEQDSVVELSSYLSSNRYFLDKVKLMKEPSVQKFYEALDDNVMDIQNLRSVFLDLFTCPPRVTIDNCTDKSGALILLDNVINSLENSLDQPRNLVDHLKRKLSDDLQLKIAAKFMNNDDIKILQKEIVKSDLYQKMLKTLKNDGKMISFLISSLLDLSSPLQTVILLF